MQKKYPGFPKSKTALMSKSKFKVMLIVFFDINVLLMMEWVQEGQTVNQYYLTEVLRSLRKKLWKKCYSWVLRDGCFTTIMHTRSHDPICQAVSHQQKHYCAERYYARTYGKLATSPLPWPSGYCNDVISAELMATNWLWRR
ncbi:hypothetical protein TNCV_952851 [Trichonephila clavipes]|nr:hypothetical protein TNCV_952851 [Trichonephila clavipes]